MDKRYEYIVTTIAGGSVTRLAASKVRNEPSFSSNINWGQGQLSVEVDLEVDDSTISIGNIIELVKFDSTDTGGLSVFKGIIEQIDRVAEEEEQYITYHAFGLNYILNKIVFEDGGSPTFSKSEDPKTTIDTMVTYLNTHYNLFSANTSTYGTTLNTDFDEDSCINVIKDFVQRTNFYYYIDQAGQITYADKPGSATHNLTFGKHIDSIVVKEDAKDLVNDYDLTYSSGSVTADDSTSISSYGRREKYESKTAITNTSSAQDAADNYIAQNKNPKKQVVIVVNSAYNLESLKPWETVQVLSFGYSITNLQIFKVAYNVDKVTLHLEQVKTLWTEIITND